MYPGTTDSLEEGAEGCSINQIHTSPEKYYISFNVLRHLFKSLAHYASSNTILPQIGGALQSHVQFKRHILMTEI